MLCVPHVHPVVLRALKTGTAGCDTLILAAARHLGRCPACETVLDGLPETLRAEFLGPLLDDSTTGSSRPLRDEPSRGGPAWRHARWRSAGRLASGGFGTVDLAVSRTDPRQVRAVKHVRVSPQSALWGRTLGEADHLRAVPPLELLLKVDGPEIVDDGLLLVMELVVGQDLDELVAGQGPLSISDACGLVLQASIAMDHAARHGLTHRDLKPRNIMLDTTGRIRILDFGISKLATADERAATLTGLEMVGTADYLAPEQAANLAAADHRSDVYSLGCTLYKLLTGEPPFGRLEHRHPVAIALAHRDRRPEPASRWRSAVAPELDALVQDMLAKSPADRPAAREAIRALLPFVDAADAARGRDWLAHAPPGGSNFPAVSRLTGQSAEHGAADTVDARQDVTDGGRAVESAPPDPAPRRRSVRIGSWIGIAALLAGLAGVILLTVLRVKTKAGWVEIEVPEADVQVFVDDQPVDRTKISVTTPDGRPTLHLEVPAGGHEIAIRKPGFKVSGRRLTIERGRGELVRLELVPDFAEFAGRWRVRYASKHTHVYTISAEGAVEHDWGSRQLRRDGDAVWLDLGYDRLERITLAEGRLAVEHWFPGRLFEAGKPPTDTGVGEREPLDAPVERRAEVAVTRPAIVNGGAWKIDGELLRQTARLQRNVACVFGSPEWSHYDFSFEARPDEGTHGFKAVFHHGSSGYCEFAVGNYFNTWHDVSAWRNGRWYRLPGMAQAGAVMHDRWYQVLIRVRGSQVTCLLDGAELFALDDSNFSAGRCGVSVFDSIASFRNFRVTAPGEAQLLWTGLPQLPEPTP